MKSVRLALLAVFLLFFLTSAAMGDKLYLKNGNVLEGKVVRETATHYYFKMKGMGEQPIAKDQVKRLEKSRSAFDEYADRKKALSADDAEGHYQLGLWCEENGLRKESKAEFEAAVAADPDHAGARKELGFVKYEGEWMTVEKRDGILADIAKREAELLGKMDLGDPVENVAARFSFRRPAGVFETEEKSKTRYLFTGPVLGKAPVTIEFTASKGGASLDDFEKAVAKEVKKAHEDATAGEPAAAKLGKTDARLLSFSYTRDDLDAEDLDMERRELIAATPAGNYRFTLECRAGYPDRLKPFLDRVTATFKILEKAPDLVSKEYGLSFEFPDDSYEKADSMPFSIKSQNGVEIIPSAPIMIVKKEMPGVFFLIFPNDAGGKTADSTSLQTLRDSIPGLSPVGNFLTVDSGTSLTVDGQDALRGKLDVVGGQLGRGRYLVVKKGDKYCRVLYLNLANQMGDRYVEEDFGKFLAGFHFLD